MELTELYSFKKNAKETVRATWPNRIPRGKLSLIVGDPGLDKFFFCVDLAALQGVET